MLLTEAGPGQLDGNTARHIRIRLTDAAPLAEFFLNTDCP